MMNEKQAEALRQAREALKMWWPMTATYLNARDEAVAAIDEALAEQQSGIKQVIELYDSPEQPAQQDYWQEEARRYAQNADFWRGKYEAATAQHQEPVATVTSESGNPNVSMSWWHEPALPVGTKLYTSPPASKPLTDEEISNLWCEVSNTDFVTADTHEFARAIEAKLRELNEHKEKNT